jgi:tripartite-type tricarboxylate transporter receptor subunit TctC
MIIDQASNCLPQVRQGTIKAFAVTATARIPSASDIPTVVEAGLPDFQMEVWNGIWVPHGTPRAIVDKLNSAMVAALGEPAVREKLDSLGLDGPPGDQRTPEALGVFQKAEATKWWPIIKAANVAAE